MRRTLSRLHRLEMWLLTKKIRLKRIHSVLTLLKYTFACTFFRFPATVSSPPWAPPLWR